MERHGTDMKLGKVSGNVIKRSVWRQIHTKRAEVKDGAGADCAVFAFHDTDPSLILTCMQESRVICKRAPGEEEIPAGLPAEESGGEPERTMEQLITKCLNNLAVRGGEAVAILLTILLPENAEESLLKELMAEAEEACAKFDIQIAGGQTRVTDCVKKPFAVVTGYAKLKDRYFGTRIIPGPGWDIVLSKWIGLEGTAMLAHRGREELLSRFPAYLVEEAKGFERYLSVVPEAAVAVKSGECALHDASEGGILAALWEMAEMAGVGLTIDLKKLPIRQETVEICEVLGINPYELLCGGCLIMTCEDGASLVKALKEARIPATVVGKITDSNDRLILNEDETRYMDRPALDSIYAYPARKGQ